MKVLKWIGLAIVGLAALALVLRVFVFDLALVKGDDMLPTVGPGALVLVNRLTTPHRGDLVLARVEGLPVLRRVLAVPGDKLSIHGIVPTVNGHRATETVVRSVTLDDRKFNVDRETLLGRSYRIFDDTIRRITTPLPEHAVDGYFLSADNREHAKDSRQLGPVPRQSIRGVVVLVIKRGHIP